MGTGTMKLITVDYLGFVRVFSVLNLSGLRCQKCSVNIYKHCRNLYLTKVLNHEKYK